MGEAAASEILAGLVSWVEQTDDVVGVCDAWGRLLYLNPAACKLVGVGGAEGLTIVDVFPNESFDLFFEVARPKWRGAGVGAERLSRKAGASGLVRLHVSATMDLDPDGASRRFVLIGRVLATADADTVDVAVYDEALGALGRHSFEERLALVLNAARNGGSCAVVVYDFSDVAAAASAHGNALLTKSCGRWRCV